LVDAWQPVLGRQRQDLRPVRAEERAIKQKERLGPRACHRRKGAV
jgi:hypothetical protein